jgi:hypothetical protein
MAELACRKTFFGPYVFPGECPRSRGELAFVLEERARIMMSWVALNFRAGVEKSSCIGYDVVSQVMPHFRAVGPLLQHNSEFPEEEGLGDLVNCPHDLDEMV